MRVWCVLVLVLCVALGAASGQKPTRAEAAAAQIPEGSELHTVVARTMVRGKIVAPPPPGAADDDLEPLEPKPKAKKAKSVKAKPEKAKAVAAVESKKKPKASVQPGAASAAAVAAVPKAPKDELIKWIRAHAAVGTPEAEFKKIELYLKGQLISTFEDLLSRGEEGIKALTVSDEWRHKFLEVLIDHIGKTRKVDDGMLVPTPPLRKAVPKKKCNKQPRFLSVAVNNAAPSPVGDWLRRALPDVKPLRMSRTILALERQSIRTFEDLRKIGVDGVGRLLYVPDGIREALRDAIIYSIGTEGHDDGKFVPAVRYVPPPPPKDECA